MCGRAPFDGAVSEAHTSQEGRRSANTAVAQMDLWRTLPLLALSFVTVQLGLLMASADQPHAPRQRLIIVGLLVCQLCFALALSLCRRKGEGTERATPAASVPPASGPGHSGLHCGARFLFLRPLACFVRVALLCCQYFSAARLDGLCRFRSTKQAGVLPGPKRGCRRICLDRSAAAFAECL